jgi:hypothetical protein
MSKQFIYLAGVLFMIVGVSSTVTAEEHTSLLNSTTVDAAMNVSLNDTLNATTSEPMNAISNETIVAAPNENLNDIANETLNQTGLNEYIPILNETASVLNATMQENETSELSQADNAGVASEVSQPAMNQIESSKNTIFAIGGSLEPNDIFQINGNIELQKPFELDLPTKPVKDLSAAFFAGNII